MEQWILWIYWLVSYSGSYTLQEKVIGWQSFWKTAEMELREASGWLHAVAQNARVRNKKVQARRNHWKLRSSPTVSSLSSSARHWNLRLKSVGFIHHYHNTDRSPAWIKQRRPGLCLPLVHQ